MWRVGNSAAFIDTILGAGISVALQSGQLLAQAIVKYAQDEQRLKYYQQEYRCRFAGQRRLAALFGHFAHDPLIAGLIIRLLDTNNKIRKSAMNYSRPGFDSLVRLQQVKGALSEV